MDNCLNLLLPLAESDKSCLLLLDENLADSDLNIDLKGKVKCLSNRFDIALQLQAFDCQFNDWDLSVYPQLFDRILFRISKEKPINHHIINQALKKLTPHGEIIFSGQKKQGIKNYAQKLKQQLGNGSLEKHGLDYLFRAQVENHQHQIFDDQDYSNLRPINSGATIKSKPGQFGWNKLDAGSSLLIAELNKLNLTQALSVLDLGCGYGYLSLAALSSELKINKLCATDNNAAAIISATANLEPWKNTIDLDVVAADCGQSIDQRFDLILCNPPFHQGFAVDDSLGDRFLASAKQHLNSGGVALFVVNSFLPLEKKSKSLFKRCECLHNNKQFKVLKLSNN